MKNYGRGIKYNLSNMISDVRGLGLIELMIVLALLSITMGIAYTFYTFGLSTFSIGEKQVDVQQNARMVADFITRELRVAEKIVILDSYEDIEELEIDESLEEYRLHYIYLKEGSVFYEQMGEPDIRDIVENISGEIEFDLEFKKSETRENLINFNLDAVNIESGRTYSLETEVMALNLEEVEDQSDGSGSAVFYQIPAPPEPYIESIVLSPQVHEYEDSEETHDVEITVSTHNVPGGSTVNAEFRKLEGEDESSEVTEVDPVSDLPVEDNYAQFNVDVPKDLDYGHYFFRVSVVNESEDVEISQRRYYYIYPQIYDIHIEKKPGEPHFGTVTIETGGVPPGTEADIVLLEDPEDEDSVVEFSYHSGGPEVNEDGDIIFEIKLENDEDYGKDLILVATIGKTTRNSEEFFLEIDPILEDLTVDPGALDPVFDPYIQDYTVEVVVETENIDITPTLDDLDHTLKINDDDDANSGEPVSIELVEDETVIEIEVIDTVENLSRIYTVTVTVSKGND